MTARWRSSRQGHWTRDWQQRSGGTFICISLKWKIHWEKLQQIKQRKKRQSHPLPADPMPPMEKLTIHTDVGSGINIELLKDLLRIVLAGRFSVFCRWLENRSHYWTCCGTANPPPIRMKCIAEAIVFDNSRPNTDDQQRLHLLLFPIRRLLICRMKQKNFTKKMFKISYENVKISIAFLHNSNQLNLFIGMHNAPEHL